MNCYDFELNISAYTEGELKQAVREDFNQHKDACNNCKEKLVDISKLMENLPNLTQMTTSSQFNQKLQGKIQIQNKQRIIIMFILTDNESTVGAWGRQLVFLIDSLCF